jgi:hypothetical protein
MVAAVEGLSGALFEMPLEQGKLLEFIESLHGETRLWSRPTAHIAPTFLTSAFFWEARTEGADVKLNVAFDPARSVHAEQVFTYHGPPPKVGEKLAGQSRVERIYKKTNRQGKVLTFVDVVTDFHDDFGVLRASATMCAIEFPEEAS